MELRTYLAILWRRKWVIIVTATIAVLVAVAGTRLMTPMYEASTTLRIPTARRGSADWVDYDVSYADRLMNTYVQIATSGPALDELAQRLKVEQPPQVTVEHLGNSELMQVIATDSDPVLASDAANSLSTILIDMSAKQFATDRESAQEILHEQLRQLEAELAQARQEYASLNTGTDDESDDLVAARRAVELKVAARRAVELKEATYGTMLEQYDQARIRDSIQANIPYVIEPAGIPDTPSSPNSAMNVALALLIGLIAGMGLVFLFENFDTRLYDVAQIQETTGLPTLVAVPSAKHGQNISYLNGNSSEGEAFRYLRTKVLNLDQVTPLRTLMVTSAVPGEGKSTVVASLAYAMAQTECPVVVVDGDLRWPTLHKIFELPNHIGLSSVLREEASLNEAIQQSKVPWLYVLTSGPMPAESAAELGSQRMAKLIEQLTERFERVYLDTPSLLSVTDAAVLSPLVDGVVLVVGHAKTGEEDVQAACQQLTDVGAHAVGIVVNRVNQGSGFTHYQ